MKKKICSIALLVLISFAHSLYAQGVFDGTRAGGGSVDGVQRASSYQVGSAEGIQIEVNLWGQVGRPGRFRAAYTTDLIALLSEAGGPTLNAKLDEVKIIRYVRQDTSRFSRGDSSVVEKLVRVDLSKFVEYGEQSNIPPLYRGDTIIVPGDALSVFQVFVNVIGSIASLINTAILIVTLTNR